MINRYPLPEPADMALTNTTYRLGYELALASGRHVEVENYGALRPDIDIINWHRIYDVIAHVGIDELTCLEHEETLLQTKRVARVLQSGGHMQPEGAEYKLTQRALRAAQKFQTTGQTNESFFRPKIYTGGPTSCVDTECMMVRSISWIEKRLPEHDPSESQHAPALILCDKKGPYAFQKADGSPVSYITRNTHVVTAQGKLFLPADSFVEIVFPENANPAQHYKGVGAVMLNATVVPIESVIFHRFSAGSLPPPVGAAAIELTVTHGPPETKLAENMDEAVKIHPTYIQQRLLAIIKTPETASKLVMAEE